MRDLVFTLVSSVVALIALLVALAFAAERALFFSAAETTTGTVVELRENPWSNTTRRGKYPVVEFTPRGGGTRRCEGGSSYPPAYTVGEQVTVHYDRDDPTDARIDSFAELWLFPAIAGGLSAVLVPLAGLQLFLHARRRSRERLRSDGVPVMGTVTRAETSSVAEWGQTVQVLTVTAVDPTTGLAREFESLRTPGKGNQWLGRQLTVFVDPKNPRRYLVDAPSPR